MTTITEDYVSLECSKLLKEKGFDAKCDKCYAYFADDDIRFLNLKYPKLAQLLIENRYPCITLQMAMKWLREVHDIYIDISIYVITKNILKYNIGVYYKKHKNDSMYLGIHLTKECSKYEKAVEVAIKYCLENLI